MRTETRTSPTIRGAAALTIAALAAALFCGCAREPREPKRRAPTSPAEKALVDLADSCSSLETFSEETRITKTVSGPDGEETAISDTKLLLKKPNRILYRIAGEDTTVIACDGEHLTVYSSADGGYVTQDAPEDLDAFVRDYHTEAVGLDELLLIAGADPLDVLENLTIQDGGSLDNQPMQVIRGTVANFTEQADDEPATATQSLWVGREDGLLHKSVTDVARGEASLRVEETMVDLSAAPGLSDAVFDYQPPRGAKNLTPD